MSKLLVAQAEVLASKPAGSRVSVWLLVRWLPLWFGVVLTGCVSMVPTVSVEQAGVATWEQRLVMLQNVDSWSLNARLSLSGDATANAQGKISWSQNADNYKLNVRGPFGIGATRITGNERGVKVVNKKGEFVAADPAAALKNQLGWEVPLQSLRYWVLGRPAPRGKAAMSVNGQGELVLLQQHGWEIEYATYQQVGSITLPRRVVARREGVEVRFAIDRWQPVFSAKSTPVSGQRW